MMRNKAKTSLIFVVGLLVGAFVTFIIFGKMNQRLYARSYALSVMEQAFLATELRAHRQDELQKRIEANLPSAVLAIHQHKDLQNAPESQSRSEEHTSELQSHHDLVCRLLLEKKKKITK